MPILQIFQDSRGKGSCRSCGAPIEWAELVASGKRMPFDAPIVALKTHGNTLGGARIVEDVDTTVTLSHFATCPNAKTWRRR
jgi:hypothetical protein